MANAAGEFRIAIVGAASELGRDLREVLLDRAFPASEWQLLDAAATILELDDDTEVAALEAIDTVGFASADLIFLCCTRELAEQYWPKIEASRAVVIDASQALVHRDDVLMVVPEVNADSVELAVEDRLIATPLPAATALAVALNPIEQAWRLQRVTVTCLEPVSTTPGGIEELVRQTSDLLSGREPEATLWPNRIAFNLIPQVGALSGAGPTAREWQIQRQLRQVMDLPDLPISAHVIRVPTFYGHGLMVNAETEDRVDTEQALEILRGAPGVHLHAGESEAENYATLSDAVGSEATHVGRVREDPTVAGGVSFWVAIDGLRKGTSVNVAQIAECVVRELRKLG